MIHDVAQELFAEDTRFDRYFLLYVLGLAGTIEYRDGVERFLDGSAGGEVAGLALKILCEWWRFADDYRETILRFICGMEWDPYADAQQLAVAIAGRYARDHEDRDLIGVLLKVSADPAVQPLIREDAVRALAVAMQVEDLPPASRREPLNSAWSMSVRQAAEQLVPRP